jgi:hypothetical protein
MRRPTNAGMVAFLPYCASMATMLAYGGGRGRAS